MTSGRRLDPSSKSCKLVLTRHTSLDDGLDNLMDVVMDVFASNHGCGRSGLTSLTLDSSVGELGSFLFQTCSNISCIAMVVCSLLDRNDFVGVLLGKNLSVRDWLDRGVVVILMNLFFDCCLNFFMALFCHRLVCYCWSNLFVDGGVMMTRLGSGYVMSAIDQDSYRRGRIGEGKV
jgi:hypothetical protein